MARNSGLLSAGIQVSAKMLKGCQTSFSMLNSLMTEWLIQNTSKCNWNRTWFAAKCSCFLFIYCRGGVDFCCLSTVLGSSFRARKQCFEQAKVSGFQSLDIGDDLYFQAKFVTKV